MNRWKSIALVAISFNVGVVYATACSDAGKDGDSSASSDEGSDEDEVDPAFTEAVEACLTYSGIYYELRPDLYDAPDEDDREWCEESVEELHLTNDMTYDDISEFYLCIYENTMFMFSDDYDSVEAMKKVHEGAIECCSISTNWAYDPYLCMTY